MASESEAVPRTESTIVDAALSTATKCAGHVASPLPTRSTCEHVRRACASVCGALGRQDGGTWRVRLGRRRGAPTQGLEQMAGLATHIRLVEAAVAAEGLEIYRLSPLEKRRGRGGDGRARRAEGDHQPVAVRRRRKPAVPRRLEEPRRLEHAGAAGAQVRLGNVCAAAALGRSAQRARRRRRLGEPRWRRRCSPGRWPAAASLQRPEQREVHGCRVALRLDSSRIALQGGDDRADDLARLLPSCPCLSKRRPL